MSKVLVLGCRGMVGHVMVVRLRELGHSVVGAARQSGGPWEAVDVEVERELSALLRRTTPEVVVNCVGVLVKEAERDPIRAIRLNALLPRILEKEARGYGFRVIHISSDCVFSGRHGPYQETDVKDSTEVYGMSKSLGELQNSQDLTIRTSVVGPEIKEAGTGLFHWFMRQKGAVKGYRNVIWGGVTTIELSRFVGFILDSPTTGLLHLTNGQPISKLDLLGLFKEIWERDETRIEPVDADASDRSLISTRGDVRYVVPPYSEMLVELRHFMRDHEEMYRHYE